MGLLDVLNPISAGLGVIEGGAQFFSSLGKEKEDRKALASLRQPFYKIQDELIQNRNQAEQLAGQGIPTAQRDYMTQESQRGLDAGISAILESGGTVNDASLLLHQYNDQIGKIGAEDAAQHIANIQYFQKANADLAAEKTKQWSINEYQPFEAKLKELKQNIATDEANKWGGINTAVGSLTAGATSMTNAGLIKKLFSNKSAGQMSDPFNGALPKLASMPGLASTAMGIVSPAASVARINPNVNSQLDSSLTNQDAPFPDFDPDTWQRLKMDAIDEGANLPDN